MEYQIQGVGSYKIKNVLFDLNGTLANYGKVSPKLRKNIKKLKQAGLRVVLISSDQRGNAERWATKLGMEYINASSKAEKAKAASQFQKEQTIAIGNGRVDLGLYQKTILSVAVINQEGCHTEVIKHADVIFNRINDALRFLLDKNTFEATLKK